MTIEELVRRFDDAVNALERIAEALDNVVRVLEIAHDVEPRGTR